MGKIKVLDEKTIKLIAAGEVVERPSSVLKEILENSLDAGADRIIVNLKEGGKEVIEVIDNGSGMDSTDATLAFSMHATSKIDHGDDLIAINSYGFRGEALASIAAVSTVKLSTFNGQESAGIAAEHGQISSLSGNKFDQGTQIRVENLFSNLPARAKFLRSTPTELANCQDVFIALALSRIDVDWSFSHNGRELLRLPQAQSLQERIFAIWPDFGRKSYSFEWSRGSLKILAALGSPEAARKDRKQQYLLVNGRAVQDRTVQKAISEAYRGFIHRDLQPAYVVHLQLPAQEVDVNVHPRKLEVKFAEPQAIYMAVLTSVRDQLEQKTKQSMSERLAEPSAELTTSPDAKIAFKPANSVEKSASSYKPSYSRSGQNGQVLRQHPFEWNKTHAMSASGTTAETATLAARETQSSQGTNEFTAVYPWQLWGTYIVYELNQQLIIVDQHAAAEKVRYEKLRAQLGHPQVQKLLVPDIVELLPEIKSAALANTDALAKLGLEISDFGGASIQVTGKPAPTPHLDVKHMLNELFEDSDQLNIERNDSDDLTDWEQTNPKLHLLIATAACHGSIRAGQLLSIPEMRQLLQDLALCKYPYNCPHGRPVSWQLTRRELEQNFKRII